MVVAVAKLLAAMTGITLFCKFLSLCIRNSGSSFTRTGFSGLINQYQCFWLIYLVIYLWLFQTQPTDISFQIEANVFSVFFHRFLQSLGDRCFTCWCAQCRCLNSVTAKLNWVEVNWWSVVVGMTLVSNE